MEFCTTVVYLLNSFLSSSFNKMLFCLIIGYIRSFRQFVFTSRLFFWCATAYLKTSPMPVMVLKGTEQMFGCEKNLAIFVKKCVRNKMFLKYAVWSDQDKKLIR